MRELENLKIINKATELGLPLEYVTKNPKATNILEVEEDYPKKEYHNCSKWVNKLITNPQLFDLQKELNNMQALNILSAYDLSKVSKNILEAFDVSHSYYSDNLTFNNKTIDIPLYDIVGKLLEAGISYDEFEDHIEVFNYFNGIKPEHYTDISWIATLCKQHYVDTTNNTFINLQKCNDETKKLLLYLADKLNGFNCSYKISSSIENAKEIYELLITNEDKLNARAIYYWSQYMKLNELKTLIKNITPEQYLDSEAAYVNIINNGMFDEIAWDARFMHYVISKNKKSFLAKFKKVVADNHITHSIFHNSLICDSKVWDIINLNELSENDILWVTTTRQSNAYDTKLYKFMKFKDINGRILTPKEFKLLATKYSTVHIDIYNNLQLGVDESINRIREIKNLLSHSSDNEIISLTEKIREKRFSNWMKDFSHIKNIRKIDVYIILSDYDYFKDYLEEIKTADDIEFLVHNKNIAGTLAEKYKNYLLEEDNQNMIETFELTYKQAKELCKDGSFDIAKKYYNSVCSTQQQINIKKIIKATANGKLKELKYANFNEELGENLGSIKDTWIKNLSVTKNKYKITEHDDFKSVMIMGEYPVSTCQSYKHGSYNECLLSNFDANKKILYVTKNGEYLARAIMRFTKSSNYNATGNSSLSFIDIDNNDTTNRNTDDIQLCLFLEKAYIKRGLTECEEYEMRTLLKLLATKKAKEMGLTLYCEYQYPGKNYTKYIYISRSKNGRQYIDSLVGSAGTSDECKFKKASVVI